MKISRAFIHSARTSLSPRFTCRERQRQRQRDERARCERDCESERAREMRERDERERETDRQTERCNENQAVEGASDTKKRSRRRQLS